MSPTIYTLHSLLELVGSDSQTQVEVDGKWVPARPQGWPGLRQRLKAGWLVLTGRADAVVWPGGQ